MARFDVIPKSGGTARYSGTPTFTGTYMKPGMLEFREVASPTPIEWTAGDYVVYSRTGYTYRLYTVPQLKKQARSNSYGGAYIYQGVQFFDDSKQLEICPFRDLVLGDNRIHFSTQPSISTFEGVDGIARRIQACLDDMYPNTWYVRLATTAMGASQDLVDLMSEAREFTVSGVSLLGALDKVYEVWPEVGWVFTRGQVTINGSSVTRNIITIGGGGLTATSSYLYGKGNGLLSITRTVANAEELANRIFAYGSSRNMLPRWYNSQNIKDADSVDIQNLMIPVSEWGETDNLPDAAKAFVEDATSIASLGLRPTTVYFDGTGELPEIYPTIRETTIKMVRQALGSSSAKYYPSTTVYTNQNVRVDRLLSAPASFDDGLAGEDGKSASVSSSDAIGQMTGSGTIQAGLNTSIILSSKNHTITKTRETDLSVSVSGDGTVSFSSMGGYAYIAVSIQKGDGTDFTEIKRKMFDLPVNSDGDFMMQDAYVRINDEDVTNGDVIRVYVSLFLSNSRGDTSLSYSYTVEPNVSFSAMWSRKKTFFVGIRQVGFDISEQALLGDGKTIAMRSGKCAGRSFSIKSCSYDSSTDSWVLECWRSEDESLAQWFPNTDYPVRGLENAGQSNEYPGDEFVILDIAMPDIYVQMAEQRLLDASEELLADTATERWQYIPEIDAKFMVENSRTIVAGQNMTLQDADIIGNSSVAVLVDSLTINEGEAAIPTYKVTLRDRKRKTWTDSGSAPSISSKPVSNATQESIQSVSNSVADSFFELDENGDVTLKPQYANLWVSGFLTAGGRNSGGGGGGGGGGVIEDVKGIGDLGSVYSVGGTEDLTKTFSAYAIDYIYQSVLALQNATPNVSLVNGANNSTITVNGVSADFYTKAQVDAIVGAVYRPAGNASTVSELGSLTAANIGKVYNMTASFTTTADFLEGAGKTFPAGTNVVIVDAGSGTYKYDVLSGFVDLSGYVPTSRKVNGHALTDDVTVSASDVGLGNVENTKLSTWAGSANITTIGTITSGSVPLSLISDATDLKAIEALTGTSGILKKTAANTWALDTAEYVTVNSLKSKGSASLPIYFDANGAAQTITGLSVTGNIATTGGTLSVADAISLTGNTAAKRRIYFDTTHYVELDSNGFHFSHGVYSDEWMSAGGIGSGGGSGSVAYLNDLTDVTAPSPSSGDLLSWSGSAWVNVAQSTITPDLSAYALKTGADTYDFLVNSLKFKNTGHNDSYISADSGPGPVYYQHQRLKWTYSRTSGSISDPDVTESKYIAFLDDIPSSLKNPYKLTFGSKEYDGSAAVSLTASDLGALTSVEFSDLSTHPATLSGYGITDAKIESGVITLGSNTITPLTSHQTVSLTGGTNNGTLKLTVGGTATDNIAVTGLGSLAYKSSLVANDIPDISGTYVTIATAQTVSGVKTFTGGIVMSGADIVLGNADHIDIGPVRLLYDSTAGCLRVTTNQTGNNAPIIGVYADGQVTAGGVGSSGGGGGYGVESITSNQDGTVDFHFTGGDVTTVDLNHTHDGLLPEVTSTNNGKIMKVVNGAWALADESGGGGSGYEVTSNKVTLLSSASTDTQYPSAKCVYDIVGDIETLLAAL